MKPKGCHVFVVLLLGTATTAKDEGRVRRDRKRVFMDLEDSLPSALVLTTTESSGEGEAMAEAPVYLTAKSFPVVASAADDHNEGATSPSSLILRKKQPNETRPPRSHRPPKYSQPQSMDYDELCPSCQRRGSSPPSPSYGIPSSSLPVSPCRGCLPCVDCPCCELTKRQSAPSSQECPYCPTGKCPWCHARNQGTTPQSGGGGWEGERRGEEMTKRGEEGDGGTCDGCPSGRCSWCGGLLVNRQCQGCPDGRCPWCHRDIATGAKSFECPNCPSGKCPWCHGVSSSGGKEEGEERNPASCPQCPSGRCPWCHGGGGQSEECPYCPTGKCPWCHGKGGGGEETRECQYCPSGNCPWCHGPQSQSSPQEERRPLASYNNGQQGGCPYCPTGKCPWCHGNGGSPPSVPDYEDQSMAVPTPSSHFGPPPGYQPQSPSDYAAVQMPPSQYGEASSAYDGPPQPVPYGTQEPYPQGGYEEEGREGNYHHPGPSPSTFRSGVPSATVVDYNSGLVRKESKGGVSQTNSPTCCVISLPAGRYTILPNKLSSAKARKRRSIGNFLLKTLLAAKKK